MNQRIRPTSFAHGRIPKSASELPSIIDDDMRRNRLCARCGVHYKEYENIGSWHCSEHMQSFNDDSKLWPCCGSKLARGCVVCDHTETPARPYPGSVTKAEITFGAPAFEMCRGNITELKDVHKYSIQEPPDSEEQKRTLGEDRSIIYIYRRSLYGDPSRNQQ